MWWKEFRRNSVAPSRDNSKTLAYFASQALKRSLKMVRLSARHVQLSRSMFLAVDCSYSVNSSEYKLQMQGLARAFASREVVAAIGQGSLGRIAVMVVQWSGSRIQQDVVPWTIVDGAAAANRVAGLISSAPRLTAEAATTSRRCKSDNLFAGWLLNCRTAPDT